MYSIIDKLIFPAPKAGYDHASLAGKLIYVPRHEDFRTYESR